MATVRANGGEVASRTVVQTFLLDGKEVTYCKRYVLCRNGVVLQGFKWLEDPTYTAPTYSLEHKRGQIHRHTMDGHLSRSGKFERSPIVPATLDAWLERKGWKPAPSGRVTQLTAL